MIYIPGEHYKINTVFPILDAEFIVSKKYNKILVFNYKIPIIEFNNWLICWTHIAENYNYYKTNEYYYIESHIAANKIVNLIEKIHEPNHIIDFEPDNIDLTMHGQLKRRQ